MSTATQPESEHAACARWYFCRKAGKVGVSDAARSDADVAEAETERDLAPQTPRRDVISGERTRAPARERARQGTSSDDRGAKGAQDWPAGPGAGTDGAEAGRSEAGRSDAGLSEAGRSDAGGSAGASVPTVVAARQGQRLMLASLLGAALWATSTSVAWGRGLATPVVLATAAVVVGWSVAVFSWARRAHEKPNASRRAQRVGGGYLLATCFALGIVESFGVPGAELGYGVSWNAVWIAFFPLVVSCAPWRTLVLTLVAATSTPLTYAIAVAVEAQPAPTMAEVAWRVGPVYVAAYLAFFAAKSLSRLGHEVRQARQAGMYELVEQLGAGGMGEVWRARHQLLARPAAVKLVRTPERGGPQAEETLRRFEREAQVTASLQSPHTVELYDFGVTDDGTLYYVMELLEGLDLDQLVRRFGPLPPERVVHLLRQVLDSLGEAHARGLVHRDIKPSNIFVSRRGLRYDYVRVLDFGLVKPVAEDVGLSGANQISGTPGFLAPERLLGEGVEDGRVDLYALGCVAYWLLTGRPVFEGDTPIAIAVAHATDAPIPPSALGIDLPAALETLVLACLAKRPTDRPASAEELDRRLAELSLPAWDDRRARAWWEAQAEALTVPPAPSPKALPPTRPHGAPHLAA